jgi:hypothetical protein
MKSLTMLAAGAALMVAVVGSSGCVVDWQSQGTITVRRDQPAAPSWSPAPNDSMPCPAPVIHEQPPWVSRQRPAPVAVSHGHGRDLQVRNYRQ